jgi:hypothetical protein
MCSVRVRELHLFNAGRGIGQQPSPFPLVLSIDAAASRELGLHAQADAFGRSVDDEVVGVTAGSPPPATKHDEAIELPIRPHHTTWQRELMQSGLVNPLAQGSSIERWKETDGAPSPPHERPTCHYWMTAFLLPFVQHGSARDRIQPPITASSASP